MSELQNKFQIIMKKIEERIKNEEELNFIKEQIADISILFLDQLDKLVEISENKLSEVVERERKMETRMKEVENTIRNMEKEFYMDENYDFEIVCPYCNYEFVSDFSQNIKEEIECPECHNIIELDWNNGDDEGECCSGHCSYCEEDCGHEYEQYYDDEDNSNKNLEEQDNKDKIFKRSNVNSLNEKNNKNKQEDEEEQDEENENEDDM